MSEKRDSQEKTDGSSSLEKGAVHDYVVQQTDDRYHFDAADLDRVQRRLKQRHVQMIAIAGTLGTGLFLGSGHSLQAAGPLGALIAYAFVGTTAYASLCAIGEMTAHAPISGTFPHFAARWVDPALGFALGWNYFYTNAISVPVEISAAGLLLTFWDDNSKHQAGYIAAIVVCACAINIFGVRWFGESEFVFSIIKLSLITILIITGLVIDLGGAPNHQRLGFHYWKNPGPLNGADLTPSKPGLDKFLGILSVIVQAAFSFQGMELVAVAASETESPRRNISKAVRRVFWRILVFYLLGLLITGMIVPFNDPNLLSASGNAAESPYVIAMTRAGIKVLPHIINAGVFTSAFSAGNSFLFCASRVLYGLALRGQAPKIFTYCTKKGLPLLAVLASSAFSLLAFMTVSSGGETVFNWFQSLSAVGGFFGWWSMNLTYVYFYRGFKAQGLDRKKLLYWNPLQPYLAYWGIFWITIFILINGFTVFWNFNASSFLTSYINIPLFFILWIGYKVIKRTKVWKPEEMDFVTGIPTVEETEIPEEPPRTIGQKIFAIIF
ncbi:general amino acid permease 1 [Dichomitus squalens]|uniref:General amino acid permease 1 n=1 Tax=Dichomitus squalens TaxID=114155 RepID=A0A4Q9MAG6_9APHY|nr:general amino acid permease 1 [Dichomitus squalens LYAD-421 SS1]EJF64342.1 general amino acid permease 1 [Dichomitus squalens LYAD-421 SS1]TBU24194.1 general amino acid permease 1 [Dichomitus squalens]TBU44669.1 general amino acid permease 1 [Dichomitus squalens]TBU59545.1 general amino acid permease 1 [Dichomitus squalens]